MYKKILSATLFLVAIFSFGLCSAQEITVPVAAAQDGFAQRSQDLRGLSEKWFSIRKALGKGDYEGATDGLEELEGRCMDLGITSYEEMSASMVKQGKRMLDTGEVGSAMALFETAINISPNYPLPYYARGWAFITHNRFKVLMALDSFIEGFRHSLNDFWWTLVYLLNKITSALFTISAMLCIFALMMFVRYSPLLAHDISEGFDKRRHESLLKNIVLPAAFLGILLFFGYLWAAAAAFLCLWTYLRRSEKAVAAIFLVGLTLMPQAMNAYAKMVGAVGNNMLHVLDDVRKGRMDDSTEAYLRAALEKDPDEQDVLMSLAQLEKKRGSYGQASVLYEKLILLAPSHAAYHNNLGNIRFLEGQREEAISQYTLAVESGTKSAVPYFNLSQAYSEDLKFTESENMSRKAREIDPIKLAFLRNRAGLSPLRMVFDIPIPAVAFWEIARKEGGKTDDLAELIWSSSVRWMPLWLALPAGAGMLALVIVTGTLRKKWVISHFCEKCDKVSCRKCQKPHYSKTLCSQCHQIFVKLEGVEARDRVRKSLEVRDTQSRKGMLYRVSSLFLPGSGHLLTGHPISGMVLSGLFIFHVKELFFEGFVEQPYGFAVQTVMPETVIMGLVLAIVYIMAQFDINRITK